MSDTVVQHEESAMTAAEPHTGASQDDLLTLIAISALACIVQDVLHEGLGHGLIAWLSGAHRLTMSTVALQSDIETRLISAGGTLVNLLFGGIFWLMLRGPADRFAPATRYFLVLAMAGNLLTGTGYFLFSGALDFGDWASVIRGLEPHWLWRLGLVSLGVVTYTASMRMVAAQLNPFRGRHSVWVRVRRLAWTPYFTDGLLATVAGALNPAGLFYVIASALPSTLGANSALLWLPQSMERRSKRVEGPVVGPIPRSVPWIAVGAVIALLYIFVLGRGITFTR